MRQSCGGKAWESEAPASATLDSDKRSPFLLLVALHMPSCNTPHPTSG